MNLNLPPKVTDRAFARLAEINDGIEAPQALRVAVEGGGHLLERRGPAAHDPGCAAFWSFSSSVWLCFSLYAQPLYTGKSTTSPV